MKGMISNCADMFGRIDFVSNNAGIGSPHCKTADLSVEAFDRVNFVNARGVKISFLNL